MIIIDTAILIDYLREYPKAVYFLDNEYFIKQTKPHISLPDALIAATALKYKTQLFTRNLKHFDFIPDIKVKSPY